MKRERNAKNNVAHRPNRPARPAAAPAKPGRNRAPGPRYALRQGLGAWELIFDGQSATIKDELGVHYVAYLLSHPPEEPIPALELAMRVEPAAPETSAVTEIEDPVTGEIVVVDKDAVVQERSLALDDAEVLQGLRREQHKLEAILEDRSASEPVKAEVRRDLEALYEFEEKEGWRTQTETRRAADRVGKAIKRLQERLVEAIDATGAPCLLLREFGIHLRNRLLIPSGRTGGHGGDRVWGPVGCFTYLPPDGVSWGS